ncbi:hypothetical protein MH050_19250 [Bacillus licheniformis]|uniref:hypothetical protein n=1 Tax=Bacillus licheniformis TaxID=1402 RepID=UPI001CD1C60F|nr:hypothetical protein [Bacillus licheniformis]MCA1184805.1 hypothetical protein [Bacillus licheniformis]MCY7742949.1 hypothetical protein [Bacillus licheniformis]
MYSSKNDREIMDFVIRRIEESPLREIRVHDFNEACVRVTGFYLDMDSIEEAERLHEALPHAYAKVSLDDQELGQKISSALDKSGHLDSIKQQAEWEAKGKIDYSKIKLDAPSLPGQNGLAITFSITYEK